MQNGALYRCKNFLPDVYLGDPINVIQVLSIMQAHEISLVNISDQHHSQLSLREIFSSSFVPISYGGSISSVEDAVELINTGCEKIILGSHYYQNSDLSEQIARSVGRQSVVLAIDVKLVNGVYELYTNQGSTKLDISLRDTLINAEKKGIGEIHLTRIDLTGTLCGVDFTLAKFASEHTSLPLVLGGGLNHNDLQSRHRLQQISYSGSTLFSVRPPLDAPLINFGYPIAK